MTEQNQLKTAKATWLYPPIWISDMSDSEFKTRFPNNNQPIFESGIVVFNDRCQNLPFLIREDGFIAVETEDTKVAIDFFNTFVACAFTSEIRLLAVPELEIQSMGMNFERSMVGMESIIESKIAMTLRALLHSRQTGTNQMLHYQGLTLQPKNKIAAVVDLVKKVFPNEESRKKLTFFAQSFTHHAQGEYLASFILAWTIVENYIDSLWEQFLSSKEIRGDRKNNLTGRDWTVNHKLQTLNLAGVVKNDNFHTLDVLRKKRNDFVHDMEEISNAQSLECLKLAAFVIGKEISNLNNAQ